MYLIKPAILIYPFLASNQSNVFHAKNEPLMQQIVDSSKYSGTKILLSKTR